MEEKREYISDKGEVVTAYLSSYYKYCAKEGQEINPDMEDSEGYVITWEDGYASFMGKMSFEITHRLLSTVIE